MFDEFLDLFERDGRKREPRSRNLLSRLADLAPDTDDRPSGRRHD